MSRQRIEGKSYGQRVPPLTSVLKSILERYPDGGQILKEIIQNADDASATKISFLLDSRNNPYGKSSLYNPELAKFQGPALYAFNNALFKQEDWDGLQSLMDSSKKEDPLKVGRFGIGFNSIYHVTDLPSIVSGELLAFLDPHEEYFGRRETGKQFNLHEPLLQVYQDQFSPYENVLDCNISSHFLHGTLFRFPLRTEPSDLSRKLYTADKVRNLFKSLKEEASLILLFLKNIEEINLYETDGNSKERLIFRVRLHDNCRKRVREERQRLLRLVPEWESGRQEVLELNLEMVFEIFDETLRTTRQDRWITHNRIGDDQSKLRSKAQNLHLLPWIGFAAPLTVEGGRRIGNNGGRIFCFLPLPPDADARTGYPVHIHGYFGLTDNRRGLKWPGSECQNDDMAEWNEDLMNYVGSQAYANLLQAMTSYVTTSKDMVNIFYQCWPNQQNVNKHWKKIIDSVFSQLLVKKVFWTWSCGGRWMNLNQAVLERLRCNNLTAKTKEIVKNVLLLANEPIVSLPLHVDEFFRVNVKKIRTVTPMYLRVILKKNRQGSWDMAKMTKEERIAMLEYIITDNNFADFEGIELLPLADGRFSSFKAGSRCGHTDFVYVETPDNRMSLLPGMESRFLDPNIACLVRVAADQNNYRQCPLQLVRLNPQTVVSLLWQVIPNELLQSNDPIALNPLNGRHPSETWIAEIWRWLKHKFAYDLTRVEGLPLIKCSLGMQRALTKLTRNTKVIRQHSSDTGSSLTRDVVGLLKTAGIIVLPEVPSYMMEHPCFSMYVAHATPEGVLQVLRNVGPQKSIAAVMSSNPQVKRSLRAFLCSITAKLSNDDKIFLKSLPVFEAIDQTSFISAQNKKFTAPNGYSSQISIKIKNASTILSVEDYSSNQLLKILNVPEMTMAQFLMEEIFPHLSWYDVTQITNLMCWVLRRIAIFKSESPYFCSYIMGLIFVDAGHGMLFKPQDLFDPRIEITRRLFEGEKSRFPMGQFASEDILVALCSLGLKQKPDPHDLVSLVSNLYNFNCDQRCRKAQALLEILDGNPSFLTTKVNVLATSIMLKDYLQSVAWVPCTDSRPAGYPQCMPWKSDGKSLLKPEDVVASHYSTVVGAVMSVLQNEPTSQIKSIFGWNSPPGSSNVLEQLRFACRVDVGVLQGKEREDFCRMLKLIYKAIAVKNISDYYACLFQDNFAWVWNGQGFSSPKNIAFERRFNFDLEPYLFTLPKEIQDPELGVFFSTSGVKNCFDEEDVLGVLHQIKIKHGNLQQNREVVRKDKQIALDILHWIVRDGALDLELRDKVYVPVMKDPDILKLVPLTECTFCDAAWLRGNFLELKMLPELSEFSLIDESISNTTAFHLGVPPLSKCVMAPEKIGFEQAGPYEPITTRLKNILDEYKEGAGVFKELIQNADDAGATEVKFLVDWRQHPVQRLFAEGMKETQGPALLAYNNAIFTKNDFENINKLAGATKKEDLDKIGRFGLGFNSVYHFTDTPSFISSHYAVFFDPNTKHLGHFITNPSHPGIKLNLAAKRNTLLYYPDQFQPYHGVFDCNVDRNAPFNFDGTLFRFPFRLGPSEICSKQYSKQDVDVLIESFNRSASTILLNTQNVENVSIWEIDQNAEAASDMQLLTKVDRNTLSSSCTLNDTTFLQDCAEWSKGTAHREEDPPQRTKIVSVSHLNNKKEQQETQTDYWLQCDRLGDGVSLQMATSKEGKMKGLLSCSGVTAKLSGVESRNSWKMQENKGEAFCFLPLSIRTGLPVHVNGYFAVTSNRRGIWEQTAEENQSSQPIEARWNKALMNDGIAQAYLQLLKKAVEMEKQGSLQEYNFCSLWPNSDNLQSQVWMPLIVGVYKLIAKSSFPLLKSGEEWYILRDCIFPDHELQMVHGSLQILKELGYNIVDLPLFARKGFLFAECGMEIESRTLSQEKFLEDVFFPNIKAIAGALRNKVICYVIDECLTTNNDSKKERFKQLIGDNACIPCSWNSQELAYPRDLISPNGAAASLYLPIDNKMPVGDCFHAPQRLLVLQDLGMVKDILNWDHICDRAKSVKSFDYSDGLKRLFKLVKYLNHHISDMPSPDIKTSEYLTSLPIFPVMPKPKTYLFPWEGESLKPQTMLSSNELFDKKFTNIIGALKRILDESENTGCGNLKLEVRKLFQIQEHKPEVGEALKQLQIISKHFEETDECKSTEIVSSICNDIYLFLKMRTCNEEETNLMKEVLQSFSWVFVEDRFVKSELLAFEWNGFGAPYLYRVPKSLSSYSELLTQIGVKKTFDEQDFLFALNEMKREKGDEKLNDSEFKVSKEFLDELNGLLDKIPEGAVGCTPMPDHERVLRPAQDLVINDAPWITMRDDIKYVHPDISIKLAHALGTKDIRSKSLEDISRPVGQPFGQKELLTDRLAGILKSYPCDFGILKELLQNADDAKATEIHFVYDTRHHGGERVFSESWKELQGPALCVYNDRPFSEKDIEGIQRLGIGSKADSPEKTGQYGIGFNAVYHLTDCPSFITNGNTLCILDPHARYVPGASKANPGRIIGPFERLQTENYRDVFPGYLGELFDLQGSTMFRLPLRNKEMARKSDISQKEVIGMIKSLLIHFKTEAKETLLFLNHVKKISISTIEEGEFKLMYEVFAELNEEDEDKRRELAVHVKRSKQLETNEITRFGIFYLITLKDTYKEERWLVQQTIGVSSSSRQIEIPDGKYNGLLPRAGIAAKVTTKEEFKEGTIQRRSPGPEKRKAFCFLPLPITTGLPVHVNGHFALDSGRRDLWKDESENTFRTKWNTFMKTEVIADAYVSLLREARKHLPHLKNEETFCFSYAYEVSYSLKWFEGLFPSQDQSESQWKKLVVAVLNKITQKDLKVLPLHRKEKTEDGSKHSIVWLSPSEGFFPNQTCNWNLSNILRCIGFNLVSLPYAIYQNFKEANTLVKELSPDHVLMFLSSHEPLLRMLPCPIKDSSIESTADVLHLLSYCMQSPAFSKNLDGIPLLLTKDYVLRKFSKKRPVYITTFSHLVPSEEHYERFAAKEIVTALKNVCKELFLLSPPVALPLKLSDLAAFCPFIFREHEVWSLTNISISWDPTGDNLEIAKWLKDLWYFISKEHEEKPSDCFLEPLKSWPVIPTTSGHLVPVSISKTILDLTESESWSLHQRNIIRALRKLKCPEVDIKLMKAKGGNVHDVVKTYLAYPNSVNDVIVVLDSLMKSEKDISGRINESEAKLLLQFLQEDPQTLKASTRNVSVLRRLPLYKTIDGRLIKLEGALFVCKTPPDIPLEESNLWMERTKNVFLEPSQALDLLHQMLGVEMKSHASCYIDFIFPKFSLLKESTRITHLSYIKDDLLRRLESTEAIRLETALKNLKFIPNLNSGDLCPAAHYYDPRNPVFKAMLSKDKFPTKPFSSDEWLNFLYQIGLQTTFSKDQFIGFARDIEREAGQSVTKALLKKSQVLTQYLLQETSLHDANTLREVSTIEFVVAHKADEKFNSLVKQFLFEEKSTAPIISFRNTLSSKHEILVWSSAALLPNWAWPSEKFIRENLGILEDPSLEQIKRQVQKLCKRFDSTDLDLKESLRKLLAEIMHETYSFLQNSMHNSNIHQFFHDVPLVLVEDGRVFVRCEQLAFEMQKYDEQPPYLYKVPREFGQFDPLFKCLGAFEKPCPTQYACILQSIWRRSKDDVVHPEEMRQVEKAVCGLFRTLKRLHKKDEFSKGKTTKCLNSLEKVKVLYLPNEKKQLKPSNLLYHVSDSPQLIERISNSEFTYDMLLELHRCGLRNDRQQDLLGYLPPCLQVKSLSKVLVEELQADCIDKKCKMDQSEKCPSANRLRALLGSEHLTDGIIRILKNQERSANINDELRNKVESVRKRFVVICFEKLVTVLKNDKDEEIHGSSALSTYFSKDDGAKTFIFIQHGARDVYSKRSRDLCLAINKHTDNAINREEFSHLEYIILLGLLRRPEDIPFSLDHRGIERDIEVSRNTASSTSFLGRLIPPELHFLLVQFDDLLFRPDEIVGYEKEDSPEDEQGIYIYARIVRETTAKNFGEKTKKAKRDPVTGKRKRQSPFNRKYLIDIGGEGVFEVDVLDLYKLKRPEEISDATGNYTDNTLSDCQDVVPYEGEEQAGAKASKPKGSPGLPRTLEAAIKEVDKALADIMKLPEEKRHKAIKRLYLRWHPDKNPDLVELSTEVVKYIQNEFKRLSEGGSHGASKGGFNDDEWESFFRNCNQRARRQRSSYDNYRRTNPGFARNFSYAGGYASSNRRSYGATPSWDSESTSFGQRRSNYHSPDAKMARIWLIQSRGDLESVKHLFSAKTTGGFYWLICFQCSQVVEKALKAALYSTSGISDSQLESHDLSSLAYDLSRLPRGPDVIHSAGTLWSYYEPTRYPHKQVPAKPPKEVYTFQQAQEAYEAAKSVMKTLEEFIGILHI